MFVLWLLLLRRLVRLLLRLGRFVIVLGIEVKRRAWVDPFSSAPWVHGPPVGIKPSVNANKGYSVQYYVVNVLLEISM